MIRRLSALLIAVACGFALPTPNQAQEPSPSPDPRFGIVEAEDAPQFASDLGVGWGRARFLWSSVQPDSPQQWVEAEISAEEIAEEINSEREVIGLLIGGIPAWAKDQKGLPSGLYLAEDDPNNTWAGYVRQAVNRYQGQIDHWIIWNEPDVWDSEHPGYTWPGTEADFVQLMRVSYLVAKEANPDVIIHLGAMSHWWDALYDRELYFDRLLDVLIADPRASEHNYYYDVATLHLYFNPEDVHDLLILYQAIQSEHGLDKPIWLVETNAAPSDDPAWPVADPTFKVSLFEQAAYMPQGMALALAAGAEGVGIYKLIDTPGDLVANPEPFGLIRADGSQRPAYRASQVAIEQLSGAQDVKWTHREIVAQVVIKKSNTLIRLLWSRVPEAQEVQIPAHQGEAVLIDMWGNRQTISSSSGTYTLQLIGAECGETVGDHCMIGGSVIYVVESLDVSALSPEDNSVVITQSGGIVFSQVAIPSRLPLPFGLIGLLIGIPAGCFLFTLITRKRKYV